MIVAIISIMVGTSDAGRFVELYEEEAAGLAVDVASWIVLIFS